MVNLKQFYRMQYGERKKIQKKSTNCVRNSQIIGMSEQNFRIREENNEAEVINEEIIAKNFLFFRTDKESKLHTQDVQKIPRIKKQK